MSKPVVSIVKHADTFQSVKKALDLCNGLHGFKTSDKILIKPNLVSWDFDVPFSPFGVITTTSVMFALVQILAGEGFSNISIGEAAVKAPKTTGARLYKLLGYEKLKEKYGVELIDFNEDKFETKYFGDLKLSIARRALEADRIINVPVLKTHTQCKVSLGIKNLKGCIDQKSKMACHGVDQVLDHTFPLLADELPLALTVTDGIFMLEKGPLQSGKAHRKDIITASRDVYACDVVGAALLGYHADEVLHLKYFAQNHGRSTNIADIQVEGEGIDRHRSFLPYTWEWAPDDTGPAEIKKQDIEGLAVRRYDSTLCTGCSFQYSPVLFMLMSAFRGKSLPTVEVITGKKQEASEGFDKTVLFGKCAIALNKNNPNIKRAVPVKGCPPDLMEFERIMQQEGIGCRYDDYIGYRRHVLNRYTEKDGFEMDYYIK
ncbi:MAG: DUF362 domain-containing protein [Desulfocucumaceae bacterium]